MLKRTHSLQTTGTIDSGLEREMITEKATEGVVGAVHKVARLITRALHKNSCQSSSGWVLGSTKEAFVMNVLCSHIQKLQVEMKICCFVAAGAQTFKWIWNEKTVQQRRRKACLSSHLKG